LLTLHKRTSKNWKNEGNSRGEIEIIARRQYKKLDKVHDSTSASPMSDNPMDPNWGGTEYTKGAVDSGKYIENNVYPVTYSMPGGVQFYPGLHKTYPDPPNFVKPVGGTTPPFLPRKIEDNK
jgi:hypothetical protein